MGHAHEGGRVIQAFIRYWFSPTLQNWRKLRRLCMSRLPAHTTTKAAQ
jgi:hypothetical protein